MLSGVGGGKLYGSILWGGVRGRDQGDSPDSCCIMNTGEFVNYLCQFGGVVSVFFVGFVQVD